MKTVQKLIMNLGEIIYVSKITISFVKKHASKTLFS